MNERTDRTDVTVDYAAFEEWLEETAGRENTTPDDVLNQLMSTYWILGELSALMEETPYESMLGDEADGGEHGVESGDHRAIVEILDSISQMNQAQTSATPVGGGSAIDPGIMQLIEALRAEDRSTDDFDGSVAYRLEKLGDEIDTLARTVETVDARTDDMDDVFNETLAQQNTRLDRLEDEVSALETALETRIEERADQVHDLEARFDDTYVDIKRILTHLLTSTETNEERIDGLGDVLSSELAALVDANAAREATLELKREANDRDITRADCDACDEPVNVALLTTPECPACERRIVGFQAVSRLFRTKHIAETRYAPSQRESEHARRLRERVTQVDSQVADDADELALEDRD